MKEKSLCLEDIDVVLFDLDGTIYYGSKIIPGANDTIRFFRESGVRVFFATNNSTKTRQQIFERLKGMDIDCELDEVLTSGFLAAQYAKKKKMKDLYIFGSQNLVEEFESFGVAVTQDECAENLLIGYNPNMTYDDLTSALQVALSAKCIMACNKERTYPGENARRMPGCGAMTAPIEWCANRECDVVIGKPNPMMVDYIAQECDVNRSRILMVGDTYESDVKMAFRAGCQAVLISEELHNDVLTVGTIADVPSIMEPMSGKISDHLTFKNLDSIEDISSVWLALGATYAVPLEEQVADLGAYVKKIASLGITIACYAGTQLAGCVSFYANDLQTKTGFITQIAVSPKIRNRGIGGRLLKAAADEAMSRGMEKIRLEVDKRNIAAQALYKKHGYVFETDSSESMFFTCDLECRN